MKKDAVPCKGLTKVKAGPSITLQRASSFYSSLHNHLMKEPISYDFPLKLEIIRGNGPSGSGVLSFILLESFKPCTTFTWFMNLSVSSRSEICPSTYFDTSSRKSNLRKQYQTVFFVWARVQIQHMH
ncbi:hypothetical protein Tco_0950976 [Tanacetum coccineum]|uniref:Uncharacterized protein n=1 Tax=Tanacetum coccineum TaxID=301880 RepID=A0ABQ5DSS5_9ASTR